MSVPVRKTGDAMAVDRTRLAAERTLMAWVRTALSMITFGFTIYKFLQVMQQEGAAALPRPQGPRDFGLALIGIGTFALIVAGTQHWRYMRSLEPDRAAAPWDLAFIVACLLGLLGVLLFGSILLNAGPLG